MVDDRGRRHVLELIREPELVRAVEPHDEVLVDAQPDGHQRGGGKGRRPAAERGDHGRHEHEDLAEPVQRHSAAAVHPPLVVSEHGRDTPNNENEHNHGGDDHTIRVGVGVGRRRADCGIPGRRRRRIDQSGRPGLYPGQHPGQTRPIRAAAQRCPRPTGETPRERCSLLPAAWAQRSHDRRRPRRLRRQHHVWHTYPSRRRCPSWSGSSSNGRSRPTHDALAARRLRT